MWSVHKQMNKMAIKHKYTGEILLSTLEYASVNL
jgi:hypothetical protein